MSDLKEEDKDLFLTKFEPYILFNSGDDTYQVNALASKIIVFKNGMLIDEATYNVEESEYSRNVFEMLDLKLQKGKFSLYKTEKISVDFEGLSICDAIVNLLRFRYNLL